MKRISDYGINIGDLPRGELNKLTDVGGVTVGHATINDDKHKTGVTVILPTEGNIFSGRLVAASYVQNGYGKTLGTVQVNELGTLETPIALTNTLNVGLVHDAIVSYMADRCAADGIKVASINPIVAECNDASFNTILDRPIKEDHVRSAIASAVRDFEEGAVGAGAGTFCYGLKGGIGSASRLVRLDGRDYTVGILVQTNYGVTADLNINGRLIGREIAQRLKETSVCDKGSIIVVLATDIPLTARQLGRVIRRCSVGIARCGSYIGHGSGEVFLGFSTGNIIGGSGDIQTLSYIRENKLDLVFRAVGEATEEAILNSMVCAEPTHTLDGRLIHSLKEYLQ